jgi:hypothetical protein
VNRALGYKDDHALTRDDVDKVRIKAGNDGYQKLKDIKAPTMGIGNGLHKALDGILEEHSSGIRDQSKSPLAKTIAEIKEKDHFTMKDALSEISRLREDADKAFATRDKSLGNGLIKTSKALEEAIADHLKDTGESAELITNYKNSRKTIAQTYAIKKAMDADGHVNAKKLARELKKDKPLSGELRTIAKVGAHFPKHVKTPSETGSVLHTSPIDTAVTAGTALGALGTAGVTHGASLAVPALAAGRPLARKAITSDRFQEGRGKARTVAEENKARVEAKNRARAKRRALARGAAGVAVASDQEDEDR